MASESTKNNYNEKSASFFSSGPQSPRTVTPFYCSFWKESMYSQEYSHIFSTQIACNTVFCMCVFFTECSILKIFTLVLTQLPPSFNDYTLVYYRDGPQLPHGPLIASIFFFAIKNNAAITTDDG